MIPRAKVYQVGELEAYNQDDPKFADWDSGLKHAMEKTSDGYLNTLFGIWSEGGELLAIVYQGEVFVQW